jgi:hypothetical protein
VPPLNGDSLRRLSVLRRRGRDLSLEAAPDVAGALVGWRVWRVGKVAGRWRLLSLHYRDLWPVAAPFAATCHFRDRIYRPPHEVSHETHRVPVRSCSCGVYAARDVGLTSRYVIGEDARQHALGMRWHGLRRDAYLPRVVGRVRLWGHVVEATDGFRSSYAYPAELYLPTRAPDGYELSLDELALDLTDYGTRVELIRGGGVQAIVAELDGR